MASNICLKGFALAVAPVFLRQRLAKRTPLSQHVSVFNKEERYASQNQSKKCEQRARPLDPQVLIHPGRSKWEAERSY